MRGYYKLREKSLGILHSDLPKELHYHSVRHTLIALKNCEGYIKYFDIDRYDAKLLRIGILLHDIGFTVSMDNHELEGAKIANKLMTAYGFSKADIKVVTELILSTSLPQRPKSLLEKIICDVDLDYLGRKDYFEISELLYMELLERSAYFDRNQWNRIQIDFLEAHTYHTRFARERREHQKQKRIAELKFMISNAKRKIV